MANRTLVPPVERVLRRVVQDDVPFNGEPCWVFTGSRTKGSYGNIGTGTIAAGNKRNEYTHRITYQEFVGEIPTGHQIDYLCRVRSCCNPAHLQAVPPAVNSQRGMAGYATGMKQKAKTHCASGHEYSEANTWRRANGHRICKECARIRNGVRNPR